MRKNEEITLRVTDLNNRGFGVGHLEKPGTPDDGIVVFVGGAVTGDTVRAKIIKVAKEYLVARVEEVLSPSPYRVENTCPASGCGGCVSRGITYAHELERKRDYVKAAFRKAGLSDVEVEEVRSTGKISRYRNKAEYPVCRDQSGKIRAGFYATATHRVVPITDCDLQHEVFGQIVRFLCDFCNEQGISVYDEETGKGLLRHFYLRTAQSGEIMVCLVVNGKKLPGEHILFGELQKKFPRIKSLYLNENNENTNVILGKDYRLLGGEPYLTDTLGGLQFHISPGAFYQVNHDACELLYGIAKEKAGLTGKELLLDLYCGIGTIGLSMAGEAKEVLGIEVVAEAVDCANENAKRNGVDNAKFAVGDAGDPAGLLGKIDPNNTVVVIDPPRKGTTPELIRAIAGAKVGKVVYVSCNPGTLARDCAIFREQGYAIGAVTPVDLFPRTGHVESVVRLIRHA